MTLQHKLITFQQHAIMSNVYKIPGQLTRYTLNNKTSFSKLLSKLDEAYHNQIKPLVDDQEYDRLIDYYEKQFGKYTKTGSRPRESTEIDDGPSKKVKGNPRTSRILKWLLPSLDKIKELSTYTKWINNHVETSKGFVITNKVDGISALLDLTGNTPTLCTRGNGKIGFDITHLLPYIKNIPSQCYEKNVFHIRNKNLRFVGIRGEIVLKTTDYEILKVNRPDYANPRNALAGIVNAPKEIEERLLKSLSIVAYQVFYTSIDEDAKYFESSNIQDDLELLTQLGFELPNPVFYSTDVISKLSVDQLTEDINNRRQSSNYEMDGTVIANIEERTIELPQDMGQYSAKDLLIAVEDDETKVDLPTHSIAFKSLGQTLHATVDKMEWNVSRYGEICPTIVIEPVFLDGTMIERFTGKSARFIVQNKIGRGSILLINRAGGTIPNVLSSIQPAESAELPVEFINGLAKWNETDVDIQMINMNHPSVQKARLAAFFSILKAENIGDAISSQLFDHFNGDWNKILTCTSQDLLSIKGFKTAKSDKTSQEIQKVIKQVHPVRLMMASSLFDAGLGEGRFRTILGTYPDILDWKVDTSEERQTAISKLQSLGGLKNLAIQFIDGLPMFDAWRKSLPMITIKVINNLLGNNDEIMPQLKGIHICFTNIRMANWETMIIRSGGHVNSTITKSTNYVVCKSLDESSGKLNKARERKDIKIMNIHQASEFFNLPL